MASSRPERQSWKRRSTQAAQRSTTSRRAPRWILTSMAATLIAVLMWIVWLQMERADRTHFVALLAGNHAKLSVPSIPFAQHDLRPLVEQPHRYLEFHDWSHLLEADRFTEFGRELERMNLGRRDTLVVYLSAHGVSNLLGDQQAVVLCRDFDLTQPNRSRIALEEFLQQFDRSAAERKLLVLDTGYLPSDKRLGMLVNEFPREVQRALENSSRDDLWVLLSNAVLQSNTVLGSRSAFGQSVVEGLLGDANANDDQQVDLIELFQYVAARCRRESAGTQTVQLLRSGMASPVLSTGTSIHASTIDRSSVPAPTEEAGDEATEATASEKSASTENDQITRLTAQTGSPAVVDEASPAVPQESDSPSAAETPRLNDSAPSATRSSQSVPTVPPSVAESSTVAPDALPAPDPASTVATGSAGGDESERLRADVDRAWSLRDQLQRPSSEDAEWSPEEYAPQLWRELNRLLLDSELWLLSGPNRSLALQVEKHIEGLQLLAGQSMSDDASRQAVAGDLVTDRLRRARHEFRQSTSWQQFQPASEQLRQVAQDIRRLRRVVYTLPDYVHWYTLSSVATPDDEDQVDRQFAERIERLLNGCAELQELLRQHHGQPLSRALPAQVRDQMDQLVETQRQLDTRLAERWSQAMARADVPAFRRQLMIFLQTSLPSLEQRVQIRKTLAEAEFAPFDPTTRRMTASERTVSPTQWQRLVRRWRLEEGLFRLATRQLAVVLTPPTYQDTDDVWRQLGEMGSHLRKAYLELNDGSGSFAVTADADRMQLVDGRDAPGVPSLSRGFPELALLPPAVPIRLEVAWSVGTELPLKEEWADVQLVLNTTSPDVLSVTLGFQFDPSTVELQTAAGQTIQPGSYPAAELRTTRTVDLRIRSRKTVSNPDEATVRPVTAMAHAANLRAEAELRCLLPQPDQVLLIATRVGSSQPEVSFSGVDQMIQLRTHPNRTTHFRLQLRNVSGLPKSVRVRLMVVPLIQRAKWPPGRIVGDDQQPMPAILRSLFEPDRQRWLPNVQVLTEITEPLMLSADGEPLDLVFNAATADPTTDPTAGSEPAAPPPAASLVDVSNGLLCVIEEGDKRWLKWIELQPIPPRDYVKVHVSYDLQRLNIDLRPRTTGQLPLGLEQEPIPIAWEIDRLIEDQLRVGGRIETAIISGEDDAVQLYADVVSTRDREASVRLNVDRYPRAFIFEVPVDRRNEQDDPRRDLPELVIQSVAVSNFPRVYVTSEAEQRRFLAERASDDQREVVVLQPGDTAAFPKPDLGDQMEICLRADAAVSAFGRSDVQDRIVVQLNDRLGVTTVEELRFADRHAQFHLVELSGGRLSIQTQVDDHRIVTSTQRMEGDYQLLATMLVGSEELRYPRIPVVFDGQPPSVRRPLAVIPGQTEVGKPVDVSFEVTDQSGIAKLEVGLVKTLADPLDDKLKVVLDAPSGPLVRVRLSAEEPGDYWIKAVVTDRVGHVAATQPNSAFEPARVRFRPLAATTPEPDKKVVGRVFGVTQIGNRKIDRIEVTLTGDQDFPPVVTNNGGMFEFRDVPAGKYQLAAAGYWNGERVGELPIELKELADYRPFVILLKAKPRDQN